MVDTPEKYWLLSLCLFIKTSTELKGEEQKSTVIVRDIYNSFRIPRAVLVPLTENCISKCLERPSKMKPQASGSVSFWPAVLGPSAHGDSPGMLSSRGDQWVLLSEHSPLCSRLAMSGHTPLCFILCSNSWLFLFKTNLSTSSRLLMSRYEQYPIKKTWAGIGLPGNQDNSSHLNLPNIL